MSQKWEIEPVFYNPDDWWHGCYALVSMLTGHSIEELHNTLPKRYWNAESWYTRDFKAAISLLGFDTNPSFKKFDPQTPYPCLARFRPTKRRMVERRQAGKKPDFWDVYVYYDGLIYSPQEGCVYPLTLFDPGLKITSMLQVWLSDL